MIGKLIAAACAATILAATAALGQSAPTGAPLYQVEVLIFANREFDPSEEQFKHEPIPLPSPTLRSPVVVDESVFDPLALQPPEEPLTPDGLLTPVPEEPENGVRALRPEELTLTAEYRKLARLPAYQVLAHGGWVQPALPENQAEPFDLSKLGVPNPVGTIRLHLSRFLHLLVDLTYQDVSMPTASADAGPGLTEVTLAPRYRLRTERQTRSGTLQYFDHPAFGVLVKVTPVPAATAPGNGRPAA